MRGHDAYTNRAMAFANQRVDSCLPVPVMAVIARHRVFAAVRKAVATAFTILMQGGLKGRPATFFGYFTVTFALARTPLLARA